jgi:hypothetical protein
MLTISVLGITDPETRHNQLRKYMAKVRPSVLVEKIEAPVEPTPTPTPAPAETATAEAPVAAEQA